MRVTSVLRGPKISNKHGTYIDEAKKCIQKAKSMTQVRKIILGHIVPTRHGRRSITFKSISAGLEVVIRGGSSRQILYIYTSDRQQVQAEMHRVF